MSESALAKQQLKTNLADAGSVAKALDTANPKEGDGASKMDPAMTAAGQRIETSVSGFANVFSSAASSSPAETTAARLESANMVGAQQLANQVKDTHSKPSVTEQLKQVNLLAQDAAGQLKERVNLMVRQNIQVAEIRLDPADLGKMQIRVNLQQEQATVQFIVQQQNAKELLEQQMPRLREMLQQQGIQLGEGQVQHQRQGDSQAGGQRSGNAGSGQRGGEQLADGQATAVQLDVKLSDRIVDYYA
jgi:flagellar hook-length control protein FliK